MSHSLRFQPIGSSWVALHPDPKGVIFFIGGAFFGTFPTFFYRYFLGSIYQAGYTIVALPFRFTFRHWSVAISLLQEQQQLRPTLVEMAKHAGYATTVYQTPEQFYWIGHSVGCKYVALLELLSSSRWAEQSKSCLESQQIERTQLQIDTRIPDTMGIYSQRSLLIAPDISDTDSAIPKPLARIVEALGLGVQPSRSQTLCLIRQSSLFHLTAIISLAQDTIAGRVADMDETQSDVRWLLNHLTDRPLLHLEQSGKHLEPVGIRIGRWIVDLNPFDKFIEPIARRELEANVLMFLEKLGQKF